MYVSGVRLHIKAGDTHVDHYHCNLYAHHARSLSPRTA